MTIRKNGLIGRVAYGWVQNPKPTTNLCRLFWRFWLSLLFIWPLSFVLVVIMFLLGARLKPIVWMKKEGKEDDFCFDSEWLDIWPEYKGFRFVPITLVVPILFLVWFYLVPDAALAAGVLLLIVLVGATAFGVIFCVIFAVRALSERTETGQLVREWALAKKSKLCPLVTIEHEGGLASSKESS